MRTEVKSNEPVKNSNGIAPTQPVEIEIISKLLRRKELRRAKPSAEPELYTVEITGTKWHLDKHENTPVTCRDVFSAYHPYMAIGEAVTQFLDFGTTIKDIDVCRIITTTKK